MEGLLDFMFAQSAISFLKAECSEERKLLGGTEEDHKIPVQPIPNSDLKLSPRPKLKSDEIATRENYRSYINMIARKNIPYWLKPRLRKYAAESHIRTLFIALAQGQFQGPPRPAGRILEPPIPVLCAQRTIHEKVNGKGYFYSWKDPRTAKVEEDWLGGRNYCRQRCMDLVSLETSTENEFIKKRIVEGNVKYIWTSGRLCDFKGCNRPDLQPLNINGWFWTAELKKLPPTNNRAQNDWSETGGIKKPQPDNREFIQQNGAPENCLAILNNFYNDGVHWHDVACHHRKPFVCEESESLLKYVRFTNPNLRV